MKPSAVADLINCMQEYEVFVGYFKSNHIGNAEKKINNNNGLLISA